MKKRKRNRERQQAKLSEIEPMTIGSQLKKAREKKEVSIGDAYQQTRILPEVLSALEENNFAKISNPVYLKSFLRKYSSYLGLDPENILKEYNNLDAKEALNAPESTAADQGSSARKIDMQKITKSLKVIFKPVLIILLLVLFIKTAGWVKQKFSSWHSARAKEVKHVMPVKPVQQKKIEPVPESLKKPVPKALKNVLVPQDKKLILSIKTTDDVWIELKRDGKIIFKNELKKGSEEDWQADENFELWTGNAAAMNITLNGHDLGSPGAGVKRGIIINRKGIQK